MKNCESCGQSFSCDANKGAGNANCWCQSLPEANLIPNPYKDCLCPGCLAALDAKKKSSKPVEGEDYYFENGLLVFTGAYHVKRGYCCQSSENGCRNCPYR
jgi:hypothetical protein